MKKAGFLTLIGIILFIDLFVFASEEIQTKSENKSKTNKTDNKKIMPEYGESGIFKKMRLAEFVKPDVCGECHSEIFRQWQGSTHSKAFVDPIWRAATKLFYDEGKTIEEVLEMRLCIKCHIPLSFRSDLIQLSNDNYDELMELAAQGTFCNWCHNLNEAIHIGGSGYDAEANIGELYTSTILGPRNDPRWGDPFKQENSDFHPSEYSELYTKSEFCGLCHNMSHLRNKLPIVQTYDEWKNSPYNTSNPKTTVTCQDCHMRQRPGIPATGNNGLPDNPGKAADEGPHREHVWTHYFAGGNSIIPKLLGSDINSFLAIEKLTNSAKLEMLPGDTYKKGELSNLTLEITNSGAGHYLPTGITMIRQMWLDVKITDKNENVVFRSGAMDQEGNLEKGTVLFNTVFGDKNGKPVINLALADRILYDHRIPPKGYDIESYSFIIPENAVSPLKIEVILKYRSASPALVKNLLGNKAPHLPKDTKALLGDDVPDIAVPVVDMVRLIQKIEF